MRSSEVIGSYGSYSGVKTFDGNAILTNWFGHIERMDKSFWVSRCRAVEN